MASSTTRKLRPFLPFVTRGTSCIRRVEAQQTVRFSLRRVLLRLMNAELLMRFHSLFVEGGRSVFGPIPGSQRAVVTFKVDIEGCEPVRDRASMGHHVGTMRLDHPHGV